MSDEPQTPGDVIRRATEEAAALERQKIEEEGLGMVGDNRGLHPENDEPTEDELVAAAEEQERQQEEIVGFVPAAEEEKEREPQTIDGHVEPIVLDFPIPGPTLGDKIAEHFEIDREGLTGFVLVAEYNSEEGSVLSSVWSLGVPVWRLRGFVSELARHLENAE